MSQTKQEIRNAWNKANYTVYHVYLRKEDDKSLIEKVERLKSEGMGTTEIFREALEMLKGI